MLKKTAFSNSLIQLYGQVFLFSATTATQYTAKNGYFMFSSCFLFLFSLHQSDNDYLKTNQV